MHPFRNTLLALPILALITPAYGAWGDISYDTDPTLVDADVSAAFDGVGLLLSAALAPSGLTRAAQDFESGFTSGQTVNNWVSIGSNRVRFGFGDTLSAIQWKGLIGGVDTDATTFGLAHPRGTYGNVAGITDNPRNYVADLNFITAAASGGSHYFVVQLERPISFLSFTMLDYGTVGNTYSFSLWNGENLDSLVKVDQGKQETFNANRTVLDWRPDGGFDYFVGKGPGLLNVPTFNVAIIHLDLLDPTVGFDNFIIGTSPVPEPGSLPLAGLGLLGIATFLRRPAKGRI